MSKLKPLCRQHDIFSNNVVMIILWPHLAFYTKVSSAKSSNATPEHHRTTTMPHSLPASSALDSFLSLHCPRSVTTVLLTSNFWTMFRCLQERSVPLLCFSILVLVCERQSSFLFFDSSFDLAVFLTCSQTWLSTNPLDSSAIWYLLFYLQTPGLQMCAFTRASFPWSWIFLKRDCKHIFVLYWGQKKNLEIIY